MCNDNILLKISFSLRRAIMAYTTSQCYASKLPKENKEIPS